jgi:SRSO17 transposase
VACSIQSLLGEVERRNRWQLAEYAGPATASAFQPVLGRANWEVEGVREEVSPAGCDHLHARDAALMIDQTGFLKPGKLAADVPRQSSGTAGRVETCPSGEPA